MTRHWLLKTEPGVFSFDDLLRAPKKRTGWSGVRNHQARNFMRDAMAVGDGVLIYHSSAEPTGVAGLARISAAARPDPTQFDARSEGYDPKSRREDPTWLEVEVEAVRALPRFVELATLKAHPGLAKMLVVQRGQRLSVQPVQPAEWALVLELGGLKSPR